MGYAYILERVFDHVKHKFPPKVDPIRARKVEKRERKIPKNRTVIKKEAFQWKASFDKFRESQVLF